MTAFALIQQMTNDGLCLSVTSAGKIKAAGEQAAVIRWLSTLKTRKAEIVTALAQENFQADYEERAAIMEYDAPDVHVDRQAADAAAYEDCKVIWLARYRKGN